MKIFRNNIGLFDDFVFQFKRGKEKLADTISKFQLSNYFNFTERLLYIGGGCIHFSIFKIKRKKKEKKKLTIQTKKKDK